MSNAMVTISVNNEKKQINANCLLSQALEKWDYSNSKQIAIAINGEFVPRSDYDSCFLKANDCVDIVAPIQGG